MSMTGTHPGNVISVQSFWPDGPADLNIANQHRFIDHGPLMSSSVPAEPNPGPAAIANYDL